eukprot:CAMPEP_0177791090 /NCGR_PEP_ID=MMETSP0491_2-20121128/23732_1 /TAXON_ID=63592 /ORGANISM="Tetraselmis chuii, Strain PLY429" /LENGTH=450 /DNA_ID=CAMNT_0019313267 /DNA_START=213 /DNA_END=1566 /DNA_ORIENTATION=-
MSDVVSPRGRITEGPLPGLRGARLHVSADGVDVVKVEPAVELEPSPYTRSDEAIEEEYVSAEGLRNVKGGAPLRHQLLDISDHLSDAASAIIDDSFWKCFAMNDPEPWNWNIYLFPLWCGGVVLRCAVLFPIRLLVLLTGILLFGIMFSICSVVMKDGPRKTAMLSGLVRFLCQSFVASWTGVIRYHGPRPCKRANMVWVANHTSMIDYAVLTAYSPFSVIMQLHPGWVGYIQKYALDPQGCLYFNRTEAGDRKLVSERMKAHVRDPMKPPLLIFPEGTCVNNEYCVMFKRGAFDLGATVCPVAIKYNKIFVDAFWNSKAMSITRHLANLMLSWALVCDVYFLEPQEQKEGESSADFAARVQAAIAKRAGLRVVPWDGYLKYYNLADKRPEIVEKRRRVFRESLDRFLPLEPAAAGDVLLDDESPTDSVRKRIASVSGASDDADSKQVDV